MNTPSEHNDVMCNNTKCTQMHWLRMEARLREVIRLWDDMQILPEIALYNIDAIIAEETRRGSSAPINGSWDHT